MNKGNSEDNGQVKMSVTIVGPRTATVITSAPFCPHPIVAANQTSVANIVWL